MAEDPVRLYQESGSALLKALLSAAREEEPHPAALHSTLTAVGVGSGIIATASTASGATAATAASGGAHGLAGAASLGSAKGALSTTLLVVAKWLGAGALAGVVATSAVYTVNERAVAVNRSSVTHANKPPGPAPAGVTKVQPGLAPAAPAVMPVTPVGVEPEKPPEPAPKTVPPVAAPVPLNALAAPPLSVPAEVDPGAPLAAELALLDNARQALAAGNASHALRSLDDYDAKFRHPNLGPEALYLRLEAHTLEGDKLGTLAVARRLLQAYPSGPHAARARALLGLDQ